MTPTLLLVSQILVAAHGYQRETGIDYSSSPDRTKKIPQEGLASRVYS